MCFVLLYEIFTVVHFRAMITIPLHTKDLLVSWLTLISSSISASLFMIRSNEEASWLGVFFFFLSLRDEAVKVTWESRYFRTTLNQRRFEQSKLPNLKVFLIGPHLQSCALLSSKPVIISPTFGCVVCAWYTDWVSWLDFVCESPCWHATLSLNYNNI